VLDFTDGIGIERHRNCDVTEEQCKSNNSEELFQLGRRWKNNGANGSRRKIKETKVQRCNEQFSVSNKQISDEFRERPTPQSTLSASKGKITDERADFGERASAAVVG
jgi:hypothetical protein